MTIGQPRVALYGMGWSLNVPGANYFTLYAYLKDDLAQEGNTYQAELVWGFPFKVYTQFVFEGFIEVSGSEGTAVSSIMSQPELMWVVNEQISIGTELQIWKNKYGVQDVNETVFQAKAKWTL